MTNQQRRRLLLLAGCLIALSGLLQLFVARQPLFLVVLAWVQLIAGIGVAIAAYRGSGGGSDDPDEFRGAH
ncbi:hypothetical protein ACFQ8E_15080 [Isoptericola sp. NPDC056573]|uniref:hypothetical protein n=1 Tax=Isoptericola sp. NPDC056573 TaxID=3345868 RepID=UPI0036813734